MTGSAGPILVYNERQDQSKGRRDRRYKCGARLLTRMLAVE